VNAGIPIPKSILGVPFGGTTGQILTAVTGASPAWSNWINGSLGIGVSSTAGNGLLQFVAGTTKANGIALGTDTFLYRNSANSLTTDGNLIVKTGLLYLSAASTDAQLLVQVAGTGSIQFGFNRSGSTNVAGAVDGEMYFGSNGAFPLSITTSGTRRFRIDGSGNFHLRGGTPTTPSAFSAWTGSATRTAIATGSATVTNCAEAIKALIDDLKAIGVLP